jgi:hypothetical protein
MRTWSLSSDGYTSGELKRTSRTLSTTSQSNAFKQSGQGLWVSSSELTHSSRRPLRCSTRTLWCASIRRPLAVSSSQTSGLSPFTSLTCCKKARDVVPSTLTCISAHQDKSPVQVAWGIAFGKIRQLARENVFLRPPSMLDMIVPSAIM